MSGIVWNVGTGRPPGGAGWSFAHLFPRDAAVPAIDAGHQARCGYNPTRHNGVVVDEVRFRLAPEDAPRCSRCEAAEAVHA